MSSAFAHGAMFCSMRDSGIQSCKLDSGIEQCQDSSCRINFVNLDTVIELMKCFPCLEKLYVKVI
jgi:hypothetical protein